MKARLLFVAVILLVAIAAAAQPLESVLTPNGTLFTLEPVAEQNALALIARNGETRQTIVIPATEGEALDSDAHLLYDRVSDTVFVVWRRASAAGDEIVMTSRDTDGAWSDEYVVAQADGAVSGRAVLRVAMTHAKDENSGAQLSFLHAVWWDQTSAPVARYALLAFEGAQRLSAYTGNLRDIAGSTRVGASEGLTPDDAFPLLALTAATDGVDVVFGALDQPTATRVKLIPKQKGEARIYTPIGRSGGSMPHPRFAATAYSNAQVMVVGTRVVIYNAAADNFSFSVYDRGAWGPVRSLRLDASMTAREVEAALRRAVAADQEQDETIDR
ncbi:MAG: hypothetical protein QOH21_3185 [Acidobacteriota bacterium]|nr:hypothetical protein [Acidobacteriota bacterium]